MRQVKLILREDVPKLGDAGEIVMVKPGFARNYLLPQGKAILATEAQVRELEHHRRQISEKVAKELRELAAERDRIEQIVLEVQALAGEEGKLFGSVTAVQIAELLAEKGVEIERRKIDLPEPIKQVGEHAVTIVLHREISAKIKLKVTAAE
jgi:large subunit ribosomal protein L9